MLADVEPYDGKYVHLLFIRDGKVIFSTRITPSDLRWLSEKAKPLCLIGKEFNEDSAILTLL